VRGCLAAAIQGKITRVIRIAYDHRLRGRLTRRDWLRVGTLGALGLAGGIDPLQAAEPRSPRVPGFGRAKSVIFVFASGGQSQIDMWDPKPQAPADVRGEFRAIPTALPGVALSEHMPKLARCADRYTIVRNLSHEDLDHGTAAYLALTGRYHTIRSGNPPPSPSDYPTYGAVLKKVQPTGRFLYEAIHVNGPALVPRIVSPGQDGGFLGREYEPLVLGDVSQAQIAVPGLVPQDDLPLVRLDERRSLRESLEQASHTLEQNRRALDVNRLYRQAYEMLSTPRFRRAFDLGDEPPALRDRYGRHRSGQACLMARRLVEAGVPWITVIWNHSNRGQDDEPDNTDLYGWDTHNDIFASLRDRLLPRFDESFAALLEDLDERGLLDETLVVCMGEFGRAPTVALEPKFAGSTPGRKHWANVYSIVVAGAGVKRGAVVGASDRLGADPVGDRYGPWDVAATMFHALGVDPHAHYRDALDRPFAATLGSPIEQLYHG
jgi:hypothetical protein